MPFDPHCRLPFDPIAQSHFVVDGGQRWLLGCLPPPADFGGLPKFGAGNVIPRDQWHDIDFSHYDAPVLMQVSNSCVGHGSVTAFWRQWLIQGGSPHDFSACSVYGWCNGGRDAGAQISSSLDCMQQKGVALLADVPEGMLFSRQFPAQAATTAARFRVRKAAHAQSFDELCSGVLMGFQGVVGICVGGGFTRLDQYGVAGISRGQGNHCVHVCGLKKLADGRWGLICQNSWGKSFGLNGYCILVEEHFGRYNSPDWYLIIEVEDDPQETLLPPLMSAA